jgi:hypothetical protein
MPTPQRALSKPSQSQNEMNCNTAHRLRPTVVSAFADGVSRFHCGSGSALIVSAILRSSGKPSRESRSGRLHLDLTLSGLLLVPRCSAIGTVLPFADVPACSALERSLFSSGDTVRVPQYLNRERFCFGYCRSRLFAQVGIVHSRTLNASLEISSNPRFFGPFRSPPDSVYSNKEMCQYCQDS